MKNFLKRIFTNVKIIIIALIVLVLIVIVQKNPDLFKASILLMEDRQIMIANQRDIGYKNTDNILDVFISDSLKDFDDITFSVIYDTVNVAVSFDALESQLPYQILNQNADGFSIRLAHLSGLDYGQSLFTIPFSGDNPYILLSDSNATLFDGSNKPLAIGNLGEAKTVHQD